MAGDVAQNVAEFPWGKGSLLAARLLAENLLTDEAIATKAKVSRQSITRWKRHPGFVVKVNEIIAAEYSAILRQGIAAKQDRIANYQDRYSRLQQVIAARAADPEMQSVPAGPTGLLVRHIRVVGSGRDAEAVEEYEVDTALLKELRELEKQAAQETGDWTEKQEITGKDGAPLQIGSSPSVIIYLPGTEPLPALDTAAEPASEATPDA